MLVFRRLSWQLKLRIAIASVALGQRLGRAEGATSAIHVLVEG